MCEHSVLFLDDHLPSESVQQDRFVTDLNLQPIIDAVTDGWDYCKLGDIYFRPLRCSDTIKYRQEVFADLEDCSLFEAVEDFTERMAAAWRYLDLINEFDYEEIRQGWFLEAADTYCAAVRSLEDKLTTGDPQSRGLRGMRDHLRDYVRSDRFTTFAQDLETVQQRLSEVRYCLQIRDNTVEVSRYEGEPDYAAEVKKVFGKFRQETTRDYMAKFSTEAGVSDVEGRIAGYVARLFPDEFLALTEFCDTHKDFVKETVATFTREVQFYLAFLHYIAALRDEGLPFCYPEIATEDKEVHSRSCFDLALAHNLVTDGTRVVLNDFFLREEERIFVVTGANQGGKTTFARMFGQVHYLASLGCPVPGSDARLYLFDQIFTHFEEEEEIEDLRSKMEDDLVRMHDILRSATSDSIIVLNEIFTSGAVEDQLFLNQKIIEKIVQLDALAVCVTFVDEVAQLSDSIVSVVATVDPESPQMRTYRLERRPPDGLVYATSIAEKWRLTYDQLKERI